jgi:hypothetical protein
MERQFFTEVDDCIVAAYKYVTRTGHKVQHYHEYNKQDKQVTVGLKAGDGQLFVMWMEDHNTSQKRKLARRIGELNIKIDEFCNRQLLPFL